MSLMHLQKTIAAVNELGERVAKLEAMVKELQDAFVMATQQNVVAAAETAAKKSKSK